VAAVLFVLGVVMLVVAGVDVLWTVVAAGSGAGPLTARLSALAWRVALRLGRRDDGVRHGLLGVFGLSIVVGMLVSWVVVAFGAWLLISSAYEGAVRLAESGEPADLLERAAFVGVNLFTLGSSDLTAGDGFWQFLPTAIAATGVIALTLGVSYLVPVAAAVTDRRQLAQYVLSLGRTPELFLTCAWDGEGFGSLAEHLVALTPMVHLAGEHHLTYPALAYFHSGRDEAASSLNVIVLNDALALLRHGIEPQARLDRTTLDALDRTVGAYLHIVGGPSIVGDVEPLPPPELARLRDAGIPTVSDADFDAAMAADADRRRLLTGLLVHDGWTAETWERRRRSLL
jgi:hypothetical protein